LTIIGWGAEVEGVMNDPEGFLSLYPDIDLEFVITDRNSLVHRASVMAAGGIAPDLIWTDDGVIVELGTLGIVEPLAPYVERYGMDLSDYAPTISGEYGGELLALPGTAFPYIFFINSNMLQEAGLSRPDSTWTLADYEAISERMTQGPIDERTVYGTVRTSRRWDGFTWSAGGWPFTSQSTIDQEGWDNLIDVVQWMADMRYVKRVEANNDDDFHYGRAGIGLFGYWIFNNPGYALWNFDYTAQVTPAGKAGQIPKFITNGWAISKDSNHKEAAWKFIEWYMSPEQQFDMVTKDMMPAYIPAVYELFAHGHSRDIMEAFLRTFELAALGKPVPQNTAEVLAFNVVTGAMSQVLNGINPSAADALNSVKDQVRATLAGNHQ